MDEMTPLVNVDDDAPASPPPPAEPPAPVAAAPVVPEPAADPDEAEAVELPGGKHVPLSALKTVREENKTLREKAQQAESLAQQLAQLQGQLQGYQQVTQQLAQPRAPQAPAAPQTDERALTFARSLDLYTQDSSGQPVLDVQKAQNILGIVKEMAKQEAGSLVQPIAQATARDRALVNYQWAIQQKDPSGKPVDQKVLTEIWRTMPVEYTADPQIAKTLLFTAMGMERANTAPTPAAPPPTIVTESVGGVPRVRQTMSGLEQRIAADKGIKPEAWQEHTKNFKPGHTTVLED